MMRMLFFSVLVGAFLGSCTSLRPVQVTNGQTKPLEKDLQLAFDSADFVGMGVAVVKDGKLTLSRGFGDADIENHVSYSSQTIQPIGSVSKLFIGAAIVKGIELGYFTLETDINDVLPFKLTNPFHPHASVRIKHLVSHTSGITDSDLFWSNCYFIADTGGQDQGTRHLTEVFTANEGTCPTLEVLITNYFKEGMPWNSKDNYLNVLPGSTYEYSNIGSSLAAYLVELKSGLPFNKFCEEHLFKPLGMSHSYWVERNVADTLIAGLYLDKENRLPDFQLSSYPDGGLHTCANDLGIFLSDMIMGYAGKPGVLSKKGYQLLFEKRFDELPEEMKEGNNCGVFWDWSSSGRVGHNGADPGLFTMLSFDPQTLNGFVLLFNQEFMQSPNRKALFSGLKPIIQTLRDYEEH